MTKQVSGLKGVKIVGRHMASSPYLLVRTILNQMLQFAPDQAKPVSVMTGDLERITIHHTSLISRRIFSHKLSPVRFSPCVTLAASGAGSSDLGPVPGPD